MAQGEEIAALEQRLQRLIREWERFFSGDLRVPPQVERDLLGQRLRQLTETPTQRAAERFRVEQLQHRFMTYATNWERMLREREEGRMRIPVGKGQAPVAEPPNVAGGGSVHHPEDGSLYDRYVAARQRTGERVTVDKAAFDARIEAQRRQLEEKLGHEVRFDVVVKGDKVKLAARRKASAKRE